MGFENFYHVIFEKSDIARDKPSVDKSFADALEDVLRVEYTKEGFVGFVHYKNGNIECYTSQLLYRYIPKTNRFILYGKEGVVLNGRIRKS